MGHCSGVHMKYLVLAVLLISVKCWEFSKNAKISTRIVQTRYGRLQGLILPMDQYKYLKPIEVFLGVPYATPPIYSNRFSPTRTPSPWDGVRISDKLGAVCPQKLPDVSNETEALEKMPKGRLEYLKRLLPYLKNQSEDCLYLNIYTPTQGWKKKTCDNPPNLRDRACAAHCKKYFKQLGVCNGSGICTCKQRLQKQSVSVRANSGIIGRVGYFLSEIAVLLIFFIVALMGFPFYLLFHSYPFFFN